MISIRSISTPYLAFSQVPQMPISPNQPWKVPCLCRLTLGLEAIFVYSTEDKKRKKNQRLFIDKGAHFIRRGDNDMFFPSFFLIVAE